MSGKSGFAAGAIMGVVALTLLREAVMGGRETVAAELPVEVRQVGDDGCWWEFDRYTSSEWEKLWTENIEKWQGPDGPYNDTDWWKTPGAGCEQMLKNRDKVERFEAERASYLSNRVGSQLSHDLYSQFVYRNSCSYGQKKTVEIEPLISFLRHPRAVCFDKYNSPFYRMKRCRKKNGKCYLLSKDYLIFPREGDLRSSGSKAVFLDVGASFYDAGFGGASQKWFVDHFAGLGWRFDRILAWEAIVNPDASTYWKRVPKDVKPRITYYNIPVESDPSSPDNPWHYVRTLCRPKDYCVVKLDIDTPIIEEALIDQLLADAGLHLLVDELVWEHHVRRNPLTYPGGWELQNAETTQSTVASSYKIFHKLRTLGIRAHSWV